MSDKLAAKVAHDNRVLVGLTLEETQELERLEELRRRWWNDHMSNDGTRPHASAEERDVARARRLELIAKHDRARIERVAAEIVARVR
jgi:hypothetical protein